jgi:hypothetical protein
MWFEASRKASVVLPVGRVKEARAEAQAPGSKLIRIQSAAFSILPNGMLDWRRSPNFGKHSASNKFRCQRASYGFLDMGGHAYYVPQPRAGE